MFGLKPIQLEGEIMTEEEFVVVWLIGCYFQITLVGECLAEIDFQVPILRSPYSKFEFFWVELRPIYVISALFLLFPNVYTFSPAYDGENEYFQDLNKAEVAVCTD